MKKPTKTLGLFLIVSLLICLCLSSCDSTEGFKWTVNQQEKTITVEGIGKLPEIDKDKYIEIVNAREFKDMFPVRPLIIVLSDNKPVDMDIFKVINIKTDFSNINNIF